MRLGMLVLSKDSLVLGLHLWPVLGATAEARHQDLSALVTLPSHLWVHLLDCSLPFEIRLNSPAVVGFRHTP